MIVHVRPRRRRPQSLCAVCSAQTARQCAAESSDVMQMDRIATAQHAAGGATALCTPSVGGLGARIRSDRFGSDQDHRTVPRSGVVCTAAMPHIDKDIT